MNYRLSIRRDKIYLRIDNAPNELRISKHCTIYTTPTSIQCRPFVYSPKRKPSSERNRARSATSTSAQRSNAATSNRSRGVSMLLAATTNDNSRFFVLLVVTTRFRFSYLNVPSKQGSVVDVALAPLNGVICTTCSNLESSANWWELEILDKWRQHTQRARRFHIELFHLCIDCRFSKKKEDFFTLFFCYQKGLLYLLRIDAPKEKLWMPATINGDGNDDDGGDDVDESNEMNTLSMSNVR